MNLTKNPRKYFRRRFWVLKDSGIEVITFTDEELAKFAKKNRENVWPQAKEDIGPESMDKVLAEIK